MEPNRESLVFIKTLTPLHIGTGRSLGAVDLPVEREAEAVDIGYGGNVVFWQFDSATIVWSWSIFESPLFPLFISSRSVSSLLVDSKSKLLASLQLL